MFSKMIAALRTEAELANASNADLLNGFKAHEPSNMDKAFKAAGALVAVSSVVFNGLLLASGADPIVAFPQASVVALGVMVSGIPIMVASRFLSSDRGAVIDSNKLTISDWIASAEKMIAEYIHGAKAPAQENLFTSSQTASNAYAMEYVHSKNEAEMNGNREKIVTGISENAFKKYGLPVSKERIHECLGRTHGNANYVGKILGVDEKSGLVFQSIDRSGVTVHNLSDFKKQPKIGSSESIKYVSGKLTVTSVKENALKTTPNGKLTGYSF